MKQLPAPLQPWHPWLSLFPPDLIEPLGALLLRLHPQIGPLRSAPARADALPEGVGSIVQRGPYERLLITEWAYADAEPDEFIRRAASGELMFAGPEPAARQRSRRCLALFDSGPAQLGEPRLLHLVLFILLARRAEEAGALFEWGVLQVPGKLHGSSDREAIKALLNARTLFAAQAQHIEAWNDVIDSAADDAWVIGAHGSERPPGVRGHIGIARHWLEERLDVRLTMHQAVRQFMLDLPPPPLATRLLRSPFETLASNAQVRQPGGRPSLLLAPRFAVAASMLAVPQLDGGIITYPVPNSLRAKPGTPRRQAAPATGAILGGGLFGKGMGSLIGEGDNLRFKGFPIEGFSSKYAVTPRPSNEEFNHPPQSGRWLPVFFLKCELPVSRNAPRITRSNVIALDRSLRLVCWSRESSTQSNTATQSPIKFSTIASCVIGAEQTSDRILFGVAGNGETELKIYKPGTGTSNLLTLPRSASSILFGDLRHWPRSGEHGALALKVEPNEWWTGTSKEMTMLKVAEGARVIGVARSEKHGCVGLVVLAPGRRIIEMYSGSGVRVLVRSSGNIAQVSVCPFTGNIAWIGASSLRVYVQAIDQDKPYLEVLNAEGDSDE
ncbi:hypothetical protein [Massilia sp. CF038]|uniref:hypothetical protein n=1 Tax=Massilia sp. CF038 TaxID=1881045 RepID=UPI000916C3A0|nr:hypothetical protein [Massilia sp. CF038]SHH13774.1 hypothetical protein SAMN05428948_2972 [Massilia sp. CF038]